MNDFEIKKIIEKHLESIFMEIWRPIESKITAQKYQIDVCLEDIDSKIKSFDKKHKKLRADFLSSRNQAEQCLQFAMSDREDIHKKYSTLKKEIIHEFKDSVKLAISLGEKAQELQIPQQEKIDQFAKQIKFLSDEGKQQIKLECDLRIKDILSLEKRYKDLIGLSDKTLRLHDLYKNIEEPTKIIL